MSNKAISVSLYRVSSDDQYLDMIVDCPTEYYFTQFLLTVEKLIEGKYVSNKYDLSEATFDGHEEESHFNFRIPLSAFSINGEPALYKAELKAVLKEDEDEEIKDVLITSDVNFAYRCMLDDILGNNDRCTTISDDAIRNYLLLYGHQAAMAVEDFETAKEYYKLIANCFDTCSRDYRDGNHTCKSCGSSHPEPHHCNCGRHD